MDDLPRWRYEPRWRKRDGKELFYLRADGKLMAAEVTVAGSAFQPGTPKALFKAVPVQGWDVNADGTRFLFLIARSGETASELFTVVLNWTALLKK